jgi:hypothetical protein
MLLSNSTLPTLRSYAALRVMLAPLRPCLACAWPVPLAYLTPTDLARLGVNGFVNNSTTASPIAILRPAMEPGGLVYLFPTSTGFADHAVLLVVLAPLGGLHGLCLWPT